MISSRCALPYRLIALDLDGTLIRPDGIISKRNRDALERLRKARGLVTIVTGRTYPAVQAIVHDLSLTTPIIICNGAEILHPLTGQILLHRPIPARISQQIIAYVRRKKFSPVAFVDTALYSDQSISTRIAPRSGLGGMTRHVLGDTIEQFDLAPEKIAVIVPSSQLENLARRLNTLWKDQIVATRSYPTLVEMTNRLATKGGALRWLARYLGVPRHQVLAMGDSDGDHGMLEWAGFGVAMGNATRSARAASDYVTGSVQEDGVAQAIERFVLHS